MRSFSFITDVLSCLEGMGTQSAAVGEVINIGPDEADTSVLQLASTIADLLGFTLEPIFLPACPTEVAIATCSADKARALLGYRTTTTLREGLSAMIAWYHEHPSPDFRYDIELEIASPLTPRSWSDRLM